MGTASITPAELLGLLGLIGTIAAGVLWVINSSKRQAREVVQSHNTSEDAHHGIRDKVESVEAKLDNFIKEDKEWKERTGKILLKISQNGHSS